MWPKGKTFSREHCDKIAEAKKGKKQSSSHIKNLADARRGFKQSAKQKDSAQKQFAKAYMITAPNGQITIIENLTKFCRENGGLQIRGNIHRAIKTGKPFRGFYFRRLNQS